MVQEKRETCLAHHVSGIAKHHAEMNRETNTPRCGIYTQQRTAWAIRLTDIYTDERCIDSIPLLNLANLIHRTKQETHPCDRGFLPSDAAKIHIFSIQRSF